MSVCAGCGGGLNSNGEAVAVGAYPDALDDEWMETISIRICPRCSQILVFKQTELRRAIREVCQS